MINWAHIRKILYDVPVLHFKVGTDSVSVGKESMKRRDAKFVIFINHRLVTVTAMTASPLERQLLRPIRDENDVIVSYHYRDSCMNDVINRLQSVKSITLSKVQVEP